MINIFAIIGTVLLTPLISLTAIFAPVAGGISHQVEQPQGAHLDLSEALDMSCTECRIVLYGSVWELLVKRAVETRVPADDMVNMDLVWVSNGDEYLKLGESEDGGEMVFSTPGVGDIKIGFSTKLGRPEDQRATRENFKGTGFEGVVYSYPKDKNGNSLSTLFFWTPDYKYDVSISGYGEQFTEFIKAIKLQK